MGLYLTPSQMAQEFGMDRSTVHKRIKGIKKEIDRGRYGSYAVADIRINKAVFLDYEKYKNDLNEVSKREKVPPFDIHEAVNYIGG